MRGRVKVDPVPLIEVARHRIRIIDNDADAARVQALHHGGDIGGARLLATEETQVIAARLQNDNVGAVRHGGLETIAHAGGDVAIYAGIDDMRIDALVV